MKYSIRIKATLAGLAAAFALAACTDPHSSDYVPSNLSQSFRGHAVSEFFYRYGYPTAEFSRAGGGKIYAWSSLTPPAHMSDANSATYHYEDGSYYHLTNDYRGGTARQYCELRINTDAQDIIQNISVAIDSIGKWSSSRCGELFNGNLPTEALFP